MNWTTLGIVSYVVLWVLVLTNVVLTIALARLVGRQGRRVLPTGARVVDPGPEPGERIENWSGTDLSGRVVSLQFPRARGVFLLYLSPHCSVCAALIPAAKRFFAEIAAEADGWWVIVFGSKEAQHAYARASGLTHQPVVAEEELPASLRIEGAPFGLWIDAGGRVGAKGMVNSREHLESLRHAVRSGYPSMDAYLLDIAQAAAHEQSGRHEPNVTADTDRKPAEGATA